MFHFLLVPFLCRLRVHFIGIRFRTRKLDHHLRRPIQKYQPRKELLLQIKLLVLPHYIDAIQELENLIDIRQLLEHNSIRRVQHPEAQDSRNGKNQRNINTDNSRNSMEKIKTGINDKLYKMGLMSTHCNCSKICSILSYSF